MYNNNNIYTYVVVQSTVVAVLMRVACAGWLLALNGQAQAEQAA